jgi:predicted PurR-regulated permease PerM
MSRTVATDTNSAPAVAAVQAPSMFSVVPLVTGVVVVAALYFGKDVLVPIVLAVLLAFVLAPLVGLLKLLRFGRTLSVIVAMLVALGVIGLTGAVIGQQVAALATDLPRYAKRIETKVSAVGRSSIGKLPEQLSRVARRFESTSPTPPATRIERRAKPIPVEVHEPPETPWQTARRLLAPVVGPLETFIIVLVVAIFVLLQREDLRDRAIRLFGSSDLHRTTQAIDEAAGRLARYFLTQLLLNSLFGAAISIGLYWIGIPSPFLWGLLAGLMRFVPYVGAFLAALPPLLLAVGAEPGWTSAILVAALFVTTEPIMGYVVEPLVYGHSTGLSPIAVIVAAIFWTWLWGPIGLLLSTPITLLLVVMGRHVPQLEFIDVLFGDRPALTPVESFYQRMLAGDDDEVHQQAEQLLKDRSLSAYYDEVVVAGLRLALVDRRRGVVTRQCVDAIVDSTRELVDSLADHDDVDPAADEAAAEPAPASLAEQSVPSPPPPDAASNRALVLCIGGPGPADSAMAAMLAQLLEKHGQRARIGEIGALGSSDRATPDIVVLIGAEFRAGSPRWRRLEERVRQLWPNARLLHGLTRPNSAREDGCSATLRDLVEACGNAPLADTETKRPVAV